MINRKLHYAWFVLLGAILIRGFAGGGLNVTSALFLAPVSEDIHVGIGSLSIYFSITSIVMVFWLPVAGRFINRYDVRLTAMAGAVLQAFSFIGFGFMNSVYGWYLLAVPYAMGATILVNLLGPILINRWFAANTGMMMGIQMAFVGLFGAVFQPFTSNLIAARGWRTAYYAIGGLAFAVIAFAALLLLRNKPENKNLQPYGVGEPAATGKALPTPRKQTLEIPEKTAVRSTSFILLLLFMIAITGVGVFGQHIPTYGAILGYSIRETGAALSFASVGSAIGSVAIGIICDKIGALKTCFGIITIGIVAVLGFLFSTEHFLIFSASTFLHGLTSSGIMVLAPILTISFYGQKDYEKIYAKLAMGAPMASIILIPVYGFIYDIMNSYLLVLAGMLLLLVIAGLCIAVGWKKRCTLEGCPGWRS